MRRITSLQRAVPLAAQHVHRQHGDMVFTCITHQLRRGVKAHGLAVEQRGQKRIRVVAFEPGADVDQQRKTGGMAFRKAVFTKALDLLEQAFGKIKLVALGHHAAHQAVMKWRQPAFAFPGSHGAAQAVGFTRGEISRQHGQLHHLLLEDGHTQGAAQRLLHLGAGVVHRLFTGTAAQVWVHHVALDGPGPHDGHFHHQIIKTARPQARQHAHLGPALHLEGAHAVTLAQHVVHGSVFTRHVSHLKTGPAQLAAHHLQRTPDGAQHAQRQDVHLDQAQRVQVVFVPLHHGAVGHAGVFNRHQARDVVTRDHKTARVLAEVTREADQRGGQCHPLSADQ